MHADRSSSDPSPHIPHSDNGGTAATLAPHGPPTSVQALAKSWKAKPRRIDITEVREIFKGMEDRYPPIISSELAAELAGIKPQSLRKQLCAGRYTGCYIGGNPVRFWRDKFVKALMENRGR